MPRKKLPPTQQTHEYTVATDFSRSALPVTNLLNKMAEQGWRLVVCGNGSTFIFERPYVAPVVSE